MKNILKSKSFLLLISLAIALPACTYWLEYLELDREEVLPGGEVSLSACFYADTNEQMQSYGCFGVCIPKDWKVKEIIFHHECHGISEDVPLEANEIYTDILNHRYSYIKNDDLHDWQWLGFSTPEKVKMCAHYESDWWGATSITATFIAGNELGNYKLEFLMGDEEEDFEKYRENMDHDPKNPSRICMTGTFAADPSKENQVGKDGETVPSIYKPRKGFNTNVKVVETLNNTAASAIADADRTAFQVVGDEGCIRVIANTDNTRNSIATVSTTDGRLIDTQILSNGETRLKAPRGLCIVSLTADDHTATKKVFVK